MLMIVVGIGFYYNVIVSWILYYLGATIYAAASGTVPWASCGNSWNTENCTETLGNNSEAGAHATSPPEEYFERNVLQIHHSTGVSDLVGIRWELAGCLLLAWSLVFIALLKGVKSLGKVAYFTTLFPYFILLVLLGKGLTLPGAADGIWFYVNPKWEKLLEVQVWADAAMQIFFSLGPCWGSLITLASYNKFNNNTLRDAMFVATANCLTSFFAGFVVFSFIGFMAHSLGKDIEHVTVSGPGLAFVVYPEAISLLPISPLWSILFFLMLLTLGLGTQFSIMETVSRTLADSWEIPHRTALGIMSALMFVGGLIMTTNGGMYILQILDNHTGTFPALVCGLVEVVAVSWLYGAERLLGDITRMVGWSTDRVWYRPYLMYWTTMWRYVTPILLATIFAASIIGYAPLKYGDYMYPGWANAIGWGISALSISCIPLGIIFKTTEFLGEGNSLLPRLSIAETDWRKLIEPLPTWGSAERQHRSQEREREEQEEKCEAV